MAGPEYREVFMDRARDFLTRVDPALHSELPVGLRITCHLIREGRLDDLLATLAHEERNHAGFTVAGPPLRRRAEIPDGALAGGTIRLPYDVAALSAADLPVRSRLLETRWQDGKLVLRGYAYIQNLDASAKRRSLKTAVLTSGRRKLLVPLRTVPVPEATDASRQEQHCYDWSGFEITVDPKRLRRGGRWTAGRWRLGVTVATAGVVRTTEVHAGDTGSGASPVPHPLGDGLRLVPCFEDGRLRLSVEPVEVRLTGHHALDDDTVELLAVNSGTEQPRTLLLTHRASGAFLEYPAVCRPAGSAGKPGSVVTARFSLADLATARATAIPPAPADGTGTDADGPAGASPGRARPGTSPSPWPTGRPGSPSVRRCRPAGTRSAPTPCSAGSAVSWSSGSPPPVTWSCGTVRSVRWPTRWDCRRTVRCSSRANCRPGPPREPSWCCGTARTARRRPSRSPRTGTVSA